MGVVCTSRGVRSDAFLDLYCFKWKIGLKIGDFVFLT